MSSDTQTLDIDAIRTFLDGRLPGFDGAVEVQKFATGQSNPTFLIKTPAGQYVLAAQTAGGAAEICPCGGP